MWHRFTQAAKKTIFEAQREMRTLGQSNVTPEHLLLALLKSEGSEVADLIDSSKFPVEDILDRLTKSIQEFHDISQRRPHLTSSAKRAISLAFDYSSNVGEGYIGTRHLLIGLASDRSTEAGRLLSSSGLSMSMVHSFGFPEHKEN